MSQRERSDAIRLSVKPSIGPYDCARGPRPRPQRLVAFSVDGMCKGWELNVGAKCVGGSSAATFCRQPFSLRQILRDLRRGGLLVRLGHRRQKSVQGHCKSLRSIHPCLLVTMHRRFFLCAP